MKVRVVRCRGRESRRAAHRIAVEEVPSHLAVLRDLSCFAACHLLPFLLPFVPTSLSSKHFRAHLHPPLPIPRIV